MHQKIYYLSLKSDTPNRGFWDYSLLEYLLKDFDSFEVDTLPKQNFGVVVIPARSHFNLVNEINNELNKLDSCLLFLMGDEESQFPVDKIKHNNIIIYIQNPKLGLDDKYRKIGCGYPPDINKCEQLVDKNIDWFFAGQVTHDRRVQCVEKLRDTDGGELLCSEGFTQGFSQKEYFEKMSRAKIIPCPSGPVTVDTFRVYEALELGCIPIVDTKTPSKDWPGFWEWLFNGPVPFPQLTEYESLTGYIYDISNQYPYANNRVQAWWLRYKADLKSKIYDDINNLTVDDIGDKITVVIPVSPIKSHPETYILEETINNIRYHLPNSEIIITFDGVRPEQEEMRADYEEHIRRVLWESRFWGNIKPYVLEEHLHQSGMMKFIMDEIKTPLILYVEQDTPLVIDEPIDWNLLKKNILNGTSNVIRLHHEGVIPKEHNHLMIEKDGDNLLKTIQWSQRPHLASKAFYRRMIDENFSGKAKCFIEDLVHGKLQEAYIKDKKMGWDQWRVHIYIPDDRNIKRSYHIDGRDGGQKYDESQIF